MYLSIWLGVLMGSAGCSSTDKKPEDLAEVLAAVDLDEEIPVEAFIAVAEILRYVYAANGTQPPEAPSR